MSVSVIIVGINGWLEYTRPLIAGLWQFEPEVNIVCVDNHSDTPYPEAPHIVRTPERLCYSAAINYGVDQAPDGWILSLNNDVRCHGDFVKHVESLNPGKIYGRQIIEEAGHVWLGNWLALFTKDTWNKLGGFDPHFAVCGFEDADYCIRGKRLGIDTEPVDLPFTHLWGKTRWAIPGYEATREQNIDYFEQKHGYRLGGNMLVTHD